MKKPDEQITDAIVKKLEKMDFIEKEAIVGLAEKLASGKITAEEWRKVAGEKRSPKGEKDAKTS